MLHPEKLMTPAKRRDLKTDKRYWAKIVSGWHLGYSRTTNGESSWRVRRLVKGTQYQQRHLGVADDTVAPDGRYVLSYPQAVAAARSWCEERTERTAAQHGKSITVGEAVLRYARHLFDEGKASSANLDSAYRAYIAHHSICGIEIAKITTQELLEWRRWVWNQPRGGHAKRKTVIALHHAGRRIKLKRGAYYWEALGPFKALGYRRSPTNGQGVWFARITTSSNRYRQHRLGYAKDQSDDAPGSLRYEDAAQAAEKWLEAQPLPETAEEEIRGRKSTANRIMSQLSAALNFSYRAGDVDSNAAWARISRIAGVEQARIWFLAADEIPRLVNVCDGAFRTLVQGAVLTGCRYGELAALRVGDYQREIGAIFVNRTKTATAGWIYLGHEGVTLVEQLIAGRSRGDLLFVNEEGQAWGKSEYRKQFHGAIERSGIDFAGVGRLSRPTWHGLRHTFAAHLVMQGVPLAFVAQQLGHTSTRMVERHYGHLQPHQVGMAIANSMPNFGIVGTSNLARFPGSTPPTPISEVSQMQFGQERGRWTSAR